MNMKDPDQMSITDVCQWLHKIGFSRVVRAFKDQEIDGSCLKYLIMDNGALLKQLIPTLGPRVKVRQKLCDLLHLHSASPRMASIPTMKKTILKERIFRRKKRLERCMSLKMMESRRALKTRRTELEKHLREEVDSKIDLQVKEKLKDLVLERASNNEATTEKKNFIAPDDIAEVNFYQQQIEQFPFNLFDDSQDVQQEDTTGVDSELCENTSARGDRSYAAHAASTKEEISDNAMQPDEEEHPCLDGEKRVPVDFKCTKCHKKFNDVVRFEKHMRFHASVPSHQCELCGKSCSSNGNLASHMRCHSEVKPFECPYCDKAFKWKSNMKCHISTHEKQQDEFALSDFCSQGF